MSCTSFRSPSVCLTSFTSFPSRDSRRFQGRCQRRGPRNPSNCTLPCADRLIRWGTFLGGGVNSPQRPSLEHVSRLGHASSTGPNSLSSCRSATGCADLRPQNVAVQAGLEISLLTFSLSRKVQKGRSKMDLHVSYLLPSPNIYAPAVSIVSQEIIDPGVSLRCDRS